MRTIRLVIAVLLLVVVMVLMSANMAPVDLHLVPQKLALGLPHLSGVPLALIIVVTLLVGIIIGFLMEFAREAKDRRSLAAKRREVGELRERNERLAKRLRVGLSQWFERVHHERAGFFGRVSRRGPATQRAVQVGVLEVVEAEELAAKA